MKQEITIEGMGCDHCVHTIREALENLHGVTVEEVEIGRARVEVDPETVREEEIDAAIHAAGYEAITHTNA